METPLNSLIHLKQQQPEQYTNLSLGFSLGLILSSVYNEANIFIRLEK